MLIEFKDNDECDYNKTITIVTVMKLIVNRVTIILYDYNFLLHCAANEIIKIITNLLNMPTTYNISCQHTRTKLFATLEYPVLYTAFHFLVLCKVKSISFQKTSVY